VVTEPSTQDEPQLVGPVWQWQQTRYNNDQLTTPKKAENYTIQFRDDDTVSIKADCNMKRGEYTDEGKRLSIKVLNTTMAMCESGSLEDEFVKNLTGGAIYFFSDGYLYIDIKYDTGTMKFTARNKHQ